MVEALRYACFQDPTKPFGNIGHEIWNGMMGSELDAREHQDAGKWLLHVTPFGGDDRLLPVKQQWMIVNGEIIGVLVSYRDDEVCKPEEEADSNIRLFRRGVLQKCRLLDRIWSLRWSGGISIIGDPRKENELWVSTTFLRGLELNYAKRVHYTGQKTYEPQRIVEELREFSTAGHQKRYTGDLPELVHDLIDDYGAKAAAETTDGNDELPQELEIERMQQFTLTKRIRAQDWLQSNEGYIYVFTEGMRKNAYICETEGENATRLSDHPNLDIVNPHYTTFQPLTGFHKYNFRCCSWAQHTFLIRFWLDTNNVIHFDPPKWNPYFRQNRTREHPTVLEAKDGGIVTDLRDIVGA